MDYTKVKGNITELMCMAGFMELGYQVSIPYGDSAKYDFIVDVNGKFWRIQCKSSHPAHDHGKEDLTAFSFSTITQTTNTKETKRKSYTIEDIDYFATWYNNNVYLVPVTETSTSKTLRLCPPKNNNQYNKAEDYLLSHVLSANNELITSKEQYLSRKQGELIVNKCKVCNKEISKDAIYCENCSHILSRKVERPTREELKIMIRTEPFTKISEKYNVSDKTITKWCKGYNLPSRKKDINSFSEEEWFKI